MASGVGFNKDCCSLRVKSIFSVKPEKICKGENLCLVSQFPGRRYAALPFVCSGGPFVQSALERMFLLQSTTERSEQEAVRRCWQKDRLRWKMFFGLVFFVYCIQCIGELKVKHKHFHYLFKIFNINGPVHWLRIVSCIKIKTQSQGLSLSEVKSRINCNNKNDSDYIRT